MRVEVSLVRGMFIMFNNDFAVEIVHNCTMSWRGRQPEAISSFARGLLRRDFDAIASQPSSNDIPIQKFLLPYKSRSPTHQLHPLYCTNRKKRGWWQGFQISHAMAARSDDQRGWRYHRDPTPAPHHADGHLQT